MKPIQPYPLTIQLDLLRARYRVLRGGILVKLRTGLPLRRPRQRISPSSRVTATGSGLLSPQVSRPAGQASRPEAGRSHRRLWSRSGAKRGTSKAERRRNSGGDLAGGVGLKMDSTRRFEILNALCRF